MHAGWRLGEGTRRSATARQYARWFLAAIFEFRSWADLSAFVAGRGRGVGALSSTQSAMEAPTMRIHTSGRSVCDCVYAARFVVGGVGLCAFLVYVLR